MADFPEGLVSRTCWASVSVLEEFVLFKGVVTYKQEPIVPDYNLEPFSKIIIITGNFLPSTSILTLYTSEDQSLEYLERASDTQKFTKCLLNK